MTKVNKPRLRPNVCMLVYNSRRQLWIGERFDRKGHWQFPQGGVERGASLKENVLRELREELGLSRDVLGKVKKLRSRHSYMWKTIPDYARGSWCGQSQTFWLVQFMGDDGDIDLAADREREFRRWRWASVTMIRKLAARERRKGYEAPLREFLQLKRNGNL
jgi:putative (di)nucleoside polyphosphate hydrolase